MKPSISSAYEIVTDDNPDNPAPYLIPHGWLRVAPRPSGWIERDDLILVRFTKESGSHREGDIAFFPCEKEQIGRLIQDGEVVIRNVARFDINFKIPLRPEGHRMLMLGEEIMDGDICIVNKSGDGKEKTSWPFIAPKYKQRFTTEYARGGAFYFRPIGTEHKPQPQPILHNYGGW